MASLERIMKREGEAQRIPRAPPQGHLSLLATLPVAAARTTPAGRFVAANDAAAELFGFADVPSLLAARVQGTYAVPRDRRRLLRRVNRDGLVRQAQIRCRRCDGSEFWVEVSVRAVRDADGRVTAYDGAYQDISQRKQLEAELLQAQKLEAVGHLAGGMAHDFNNLLTGIVGYAELAAARLEPDSPEAQDLREVRLFADRATSLTRRLLTFSRRHELALLEVDVNELVRDSVHMLERLIEEDIEIEVKPAADPVTVLADRNLVTQALFNLVLNARDAMPHGGKLTLCCTPRAVRQEAPWPAATVASGDFIEISIRDTGTGMDDETLARALEPFFTTKRAGEGTGLGLSTTLGIVRQHGGDLSIESRIGEGTRVRLLLPRLVHEVADATAEGGTPKTLTGSETILVVEDEPGVREVIVRTLEANGYEVLAAADSGLAVQLHESRAGGIQLLLSDVILPGHYGPELFERLAADDRDLRALFISGYTAGAHGQEPPAGPLLLKPFAPDALLRAVRAALDA